MRKSDQRQNIKHFSAKTIGEMDRRFRANLINSVSGYKPANLVGTVSSDGIANLAIFSSVVHLGSDPALLGLIVRPAGEVPRHTYENIRQTGLYTINHIHEHFVERAHWTSAKFGRTVSEFEKCGLTEVRIDGFQAPFVGESEIKIGLQLVEELPIALNKTILIIGEIKHLIIPETILLDNGTLDLNAVKDAAISGLDTYHRVEKIVTFPYAKPIDLPAFNTPMVVAGDVRCKLKTERYES